MAAKRKTARKTAKKKTAKKKTGKGRKPKSKVAGKTSHARAKSKPKKSVPAGGSGLVYLDPLREALARRFDRGR